MESMSPAPNRTAVMPSPLLSQPRGAQPTSMSPRRRPRPRAADKQDDAALVSRVRSLYVEARQYRSPLVSKWNRYYRALRNRTWVNALNWYPSPEVPEMLPIIESSVGWITDQRPTFDVIPAAPMFSPHFEYFNQLSDDLRVALSVNWQENDHEAAVELVTRDAYIYGMGIYKTLWDNTLLNGLGDAVIRRVDPYAFYPDPAATSFEDANYFIEARKLSVQEIDRRFPGSSAKILSLRANDPTDQRPEAHSNSEAPKANPGAISPNTSTSYGLPGQSRESVYRDSEGIVLIEAWLREHRTSPPLEGSPEGTPPIVHDEWRCVVIAGGALLLNVKADELWQHGQHPYSRYVTFENGELWGQSMVELLLPMQLSINRLLAAMQHNVELTGNPVMLETLRAGTQRTPVTNRPGQRLTVNDGGQVSWLQPPPMRTDFPNLIQFYIGEMERVSGLAAITRGIGPGGRNAASVIDSLQEASFVRIRMASRQMERTLRNVGEKNASLISEFYTEPRLIALVGPSGERTSRSLQSRHFYVPGDNLTADPGSNSTPLRFQLLVQAGSSLPTSRAARSAEADTLFALGAIDLLSYLQMKGVPNAQQIYQRKMAEVQGGMTGPGQHQAARA